MATRIRDAVTATAVLLAAGVGLLTHPAATAATAGIAALFVGPLTAMCVYSSDPFRGTAVRTGVAAALVVAGGGAVVAGLVALLGIVAVPVVLLLVLAGAVWVWWRGCPPLVRAFVAARPVTGLPAIGGTVSTADLCATWQHTCELIRDLPPDSPDRAVVVDARRQLLDELERRDPVGFHRWLQSEPDASGDPGRYLRTDR